jgi:transposase
MFARREQRPLRRHRATSRNRVGLPSGQRPRRRRRHARRQAGAGPKKKIVLVLDRAGCHTSLRLRVPDHLFLHFLPPYSPELQPAEHLWPLTNAPLLNRHFDSIERLEEAQAQRCVALQAQPTLIRSTTLFHWWPKHIHTRRGAGRR